MIALIILQKEIHEFVNDLLLSYQMNFMIIVKIYIKLLHFSNYL